MSCAIRISNLSKEYALGGLERRNASIYEAVSSVLSNPLKRFRRLAGKIEAKDRFWALKDITMEVGEGEVIGIIGRNGAGKTTLLKILSRITSPTRGRVEIRGRLASLLEVGTGFHPELSGRENIYLNGAILGMKRSETERKFDEIVAFAGVEKFIDTPVKRYSSGMYVRLAFAVAAHLEPEILLIDEVLAVGDAEFQRRCLGKMNEVAGQGRTVVFVSHNLQAIQSLCPKTIWIDTGRIAESGISQTVIGHYLALSEQSVGEKIWPKGARPGNEDFELMQIVVRSGHTGKKVSNLLTSEPIRIEMEFFLKKPLPGLCVGFDLMTLSGTVVLRSYHTDASESDMPIQSAGNNRWICTISPGIMNAGSYCIAPRISIHNQRWIVNMDPVLSFETTLNHGISPYWNVLNKSNRPGVIAPILKWENDSVPRA
jgi:lipopolysaccharide transport system ATP-binding protein